MNNNDQSLYFNSIYMMCILVSPLILFICGNLMLTNKEKEWFNNNHGTSSTLFTYNYLDFITILICIIMGVILSKLGRYISCKKTPHNIIDYVIFYLVPIAIVIFSATFNLICLTKSYLLGGILNILTGIILLSSTVYILSEILMMDNGFILFSCIVILFNGTNACMNSK